MEADFSSRAGKVIVLRAGPFTLAFHPEDGAIRHLHAGRRELLRAIAAPVRDATWTTVLPEITDLDVEQRAESFRVTFAAHCRSRELDFRWLGEITGSAADGIAFTLAGEALSEFRRNRIGFCILHPAEAAGCPCVIEHTDGTRQEGRFPWAISPHQPFFDIRAVTQAIGPGAAAEVRMEGEVFEMEDQRNWTDASFKTYGTPLTLPYPALVARGTRLRQRVTLRLRGELPAAPRDFVFPWQQPSVEILTVGQPTGAALPPLGTIWNVEGEAERAIAALRPLQLSHLRVDLNLTSEGRLARLRAALGAARAMGADLEIALFVDRLDLAAKLSAILRTVCDPAAPVAVARWLVYDSVGSPVAGEVLGAVRRQIAGSPGAAPVGAGATEHFADLNRRPELAAMADFTVHGCNPQVHTFDDVSIVETLAIQGSTIDNARRLSVGRPAVVSPVTFAPRLRAGAPDARPRTSLAAAWMLGSIASLAGCRAASVTYFEAVGPDGLLDERGAPRPAAELLRMLGQFRGARLRPVATSHPARIAALALERGAERCLLLANLCRAPQRVRVEGVWPGRSITISPNGLHRVDYS